MGTRKTVKAEETTPGTSNSFSSRITRASARRLSAGACNEVPSYSQEGSGKEQSPALEHKEKPKKNVRSTKKAKVKIEPDLLATDDANTDASLLIEATSTFINKSPDGLSIQKFLNNNSNANEVPVLPSIEQSVLKHEDLIQNVNHYHLNVAKNSEKSNQQEVSFKVKMEVLSLATSPSKGVTNKLPEKLVKEELLSVTIENYNQIRDLKPDVSQLNENMDKLTCSLGSMSRHNLCPQTNSKIMGTFLSPLTSPSKVDITSRPVDPEKQKRLNAELQRLTQEISFENTLKPVRIQQVQALNPFRHFSTVAEEPAKGPDTDWASLAKMWIKTGEESSKVGEQLEEIERKRKEDEEKLIEEQKRRIEEETLKKREAAMALAQKLIQESRQKLLEEQNKKEEIKTDTAKLVKEKAEGMDLNDVFIGGPVTPEKMADSNILFVEKNSMGNGESLHVPDNPPRSPSRSHSRSSRSRIRSNSPKSRSCSRSRSRSRTRSQSRSKTRRSRSREFKRSPARRSRSRERWRRHHGYADHRVNRHWKGGYRNRWNYDNKDYRRKEFHRRSRSPIRRNRIDRRSRSSRRSRSLSKSRRSRSPERQPPVKHLEHVTKNENEWDSESATPPGVTAPLAAEIVDDPPIPPFQEIEELIYMDDKVTKLGKKIKRPMEKSVQCDCAVKGLDCSDNRCINRQMLFECRKCKAPNCQNQRFKKHQYASVEAFYTGPKKGFGIRAKELIKKDTFIIEYIGEVVTQEIFAERVKKYAKDPKHTHHYIFEMGQKLIDATAKGNLSRFVNHSCEPNAICLKWAVPKSPKDCSRIGFFASRDIRLGEEITFDYQFINYGKKAQACHCGTPSCKGVIGQTLEEEEEDEDEEEDLDEQEEESDEELETEADKLKKERDAEIREWESQQKINEIISAGKIPSNKANLWAARLVKNLMRVQEIGYKLRVLSFIEHTDPQFYQILKRKSLFDVFASWLSSGDWCRNDMELKLEVMRFISLQDCHDSKVDQAAGWTVLCCQIVEQLVTTAIPPELAVRDTIEFLVDTISGKEDVDEDDGNKDLTNVDLFLKIRESAQLLIQSKKFSEQKRSCAISKFKIPKKVKQEWKVATENEAAKENIARSKRRERFFFPSGNFRNNRYDRSPNYYDSKIGTKRRYEQTYSRRNRHYEPDYKRNRSDFDGLKRYDNRRESHTGKHRHEEGRPRTPPLEPVDQPNSYTKKPPGLVVPVRINATIDMDLSNGDSPITTPIRVDEFGMPLSTAHHTSSLRLEVPQSPFDSNPMASLSSSYLNEFNLHQHTTQHVENPSLGDAFNYPHTISGWQMSTNEDLIYQQLFAMTKEQRASQIDYHRLYIKIIAKVNEDVKRLEEKAEEAKRAAATQPNVEIDGVKTPLINSQYPPPPPPPRKNGIKWWRVKVTDPMTDDQFYYWNKETHATQWDIPSEPFEDYEQQMQPDSSVEVEENFKSFYNTTTLKRASVNDDHMSSSSSMMHPSSCNSNRPSSRACFPDHFSTNQPAVVIKKEISEKQAHHHHEKRKSSKKPSSKEFAKSLEKIIQPVMWEFLRKILSADTERRNWLLKQVCKEMYKKESQRDDCTMTVTKEVKKRVINYTMRFMERKCADDGDLWKGYEMTHPSA